MTIGLVFNLFLSFLKVLRLSDTKSIRCLNHYSSCTMSMWDELYALLTVAASFVYCGAVLDKNILEIIGKERMYGSAERRAKLGQFDIVPYKSRTDCRSTLQIRCDHALCSNSISLPGRLLAVVENKIKFPGSWRKWRASGRTESSGPCWVTLLNSSTRAMFRAKAGMR